MRIAIVGGTDYDPVAFEDFLYALSNKYPDAVIVTGTPTGKNIYNDNKEKVGYLDSAEVAASNLLTGLGHTIETPDLTTKTAQYLGANSSLQLDWILNGQMELYRDKNDKLQNRWITARPDVIVAVGNLNSSRAKTAHDTWKRLYAWKPEGTDQSFVLFHNVAAPPEKKKAQPKRKPKKKRELLAV